MHIGLIDADLLDNGTRHPNLALMKISGYYNNKGNDTELILDYNDLNSYDKIYISKVFTYTNIPIDINNHPKIKIGGTGFFFDKAPNLPDEIEHHMPDYHLYDKYISKEVARGIKLKHFSDYQDHSIGFTTRGCFRKCDFCVNKKYNSVFRHSKLSEFYDPTRKYIYIWDDNFFGYKKWYEVLDELDETGRHFQFRQGLDIRLINNDKAERLSKSKYKGDFIFAFDYLKDKSLIEKKLELWRSKTLKTTKLYVLCAYESKDVNDIISIFERIKILMKYKCLPYIMRFNGWEESKMRGMYINISRWANQPDFFKKK
ncbi:MAG: hypothetical protein MUO21_09865, partial [Nitrososphaeraceae archaeon]|nr:hypothetical protein [Nitrososphaeraceae archaeon]